MGERQHISGASSSPGPCFVLFGSRWAHSRALVFPVVLLWPDPAAAPCPDARPGSAIVPAVRYRDEWASGHRLRIPRPRAARSARAVDHCRPPDPDRRGPHRRFTPGPGCVVKAALFANPFMRRVVGRRVTSAMPRPTDDRAVDRGPEVGRRLVMFPEGTRTRRGQPMYFHRGAASVAVQGAAVLTPIYIRVDQPLLHKTQAWYQVRRDGRTSRSWSATTSTSSPTGFCRRPRRPGSSTPGFWRITGRSWSGPWSYNESSKV